MCENMCACVHACGRQRSTSSVISQEVIHIIFGCRVSHLPGAYQLGKAGWSAKP